MKKFSYVVTVEAEGQDQADTVMNERINVDEDYGFEYSVRYNAAERED